MSLILTAWNVEEGKTRNLENIPVLPGKAVLYDLMGNPGPVKAERGKVSLTLSRGPVFLEGVAASYLKGRTAAEGFSERRASGPASVDMVFIPLS